MSNHSFVNIGLPYVTRDLEAQPIATTLTAALFILFMGIAPVVWAALSEHFHIRRFLFLVAMIIFMATSIGGVFVQNIWVLVVVRCIQSIGVSSGQSVGAGYIADLYPVEQRGAAFGKFMFGVICGPLLGPIVGGFLIMSPLSWRATFWFCFAFGIFIFLITLFFTPETYRDDTRFNTAPLPITLNELVVTSDKEKLPDLPNDASSRYSSATVTEGASVIVAINDIPKQQEEKSQQDIVHVEEDLSPKQKTFNPFAPFGLLRHPFVFMSSITVGVFFGAMVATEAILPEAFKENYGLNSWQTGLCYLGAGIGNMSGAFVGSRLSDRLLMRSRRQRGGLAKSEDRFTANIWIAGFVFNPLGSLIFGWVVERKLSVWGAIIGFGIQCFGNVQVVTSITAYLVDSMPGRGAAAVAAANFVQFGFACILTLISTPMVANLGAGWTSTLFACLSWGGMLIILVLKIWGEPIRRWSGY
jgi:MFS family permease